MILEHQCLVDRTFRQVRDSCLSRVPRLWRCGRRQARYREIHRFLFVVLFALLPGRPSLLPGMIVSAVVASLTIFARCGIYFALLKEGAIPVVVRGTAAGIFSVAGFTPDIFMPLQGDVLLDRFPGLDGYRYFFLTVVTKTRYKPHPIHKTPAPPSNL